MESKSSSRSRRIRRRAGISRGLNTMMHQTSWTVTAATTGTTGIMSSWTAPSISHSSEYSTLQSLFTEVKLLRATFIFTPTQSVNGSVLHGAMVVSTNMFQNESTGATPTGWLDVENQTRPARLATSSVFPLRYQMPVPTDLEYSGITYDAPNPPTPWAGSPGVVRWYADTLTPSTTCVS